MQANVKSIINFGVLFYGCTYRSNLQDILNIQKRIVRAIFFIKKLNSVSEIFLKNKIFSVFEQNVSVVFCELFIRIRDGSYDNVVNLNAQVSNRICTRRASQGLLNPPRTRTKFEKHFHNKLIKTFNILQSVKIQPAYFQPAVSMKHLFDKAEIFARFFRLRNGPS